MRPANITIEEMTEALRHAERSAVEVRVPEAAIRQVPELEEGGPVLR